MQSQLVILVLVSFVCGAFSQTVVPGGCGNFTAQMDFNLTAYLGKWYEIEATNHIEELGAICIEANYADFGNGSIEVYNTEIINATGQFYGIRGNARPLNSNSTEAKYLVSFPIVGAYDAPYWVMDSDFENYSIVLSCRPYGDNNSFRTLWFLARESNPNAQIRDYVHNRMAELGVDQSLNLKPTLQAGCPSSNATSFE